MAADLTGGDPLRFVQRLSRIDWMPRLRTGEELVMFSSYDRTGGNDDGFSGRYSRLRLENGRSVLAELDGPGVVQRIYFAYSTDESDMLLGGRNERIRVYLDGSSTPALDVPLAELFSGTLPAFPKPLVGYTLGGLFSFVPLPFRAGCKVVVDGTDVHFYQITVLKLASASGVRTFSSTPDAPTAAALRRAAQLWSAPGDASGLGLSSPQESSVALKLSAGQQATLQLPPGPRVVRALFWEPDSTKAAMPSAHLTARWDGATRAAVNVPLAFFFAQVYGPKPYQSLLAGTKNNKYYNYLPMPYASSGSLSVKASGPVAATLRVLTEPTRTQPASLGYLHVAYHETPFPGAWIPHLWLWRQGRGHYVGTVLATEGWKGLPYWLEGDESFLVDGSLAAHGTGHEEYFNAGWYACEGRLDRPGASACHGIPVYGATDDAMRVAGYRWHLTDPVPYNREIIASIEHGPYNSVPAHYRSAAFFYDAAPQ